MCVRLCEMADPAKDVVEAAAGGLRKCFQNKHELLVFSKAKPLSGVGYWDVSVRVRRTNNRVYLCYHPKSCQNIKK